ncbi:MAG: hypothetical protein J5776_01005 [Clostridiales bacterium]|nr:hypothetical protein [Clostridiales bacterium]
MEFDPNENKNGFNPNGSGMGPNDDCIDSSFAVQFKPNDPAGSVSDKLKQNSYPSNDYDDGFEDEFKDEFDNFEFDASISAFKPLASQPESEKPAFSAKPEEKAPEAKADVKPEEPAKPAFAPVNKEPEKPAFAPFGKAPEKPEVKDKPAEPVKPAFAPAKKAPEKTSGVDDIPEFKPQDLEFNSFGKDDKDKKDLPGNKIFEKGNDLDFATSEQDKATSPFAGNKPEAKDAKDEGIKTFGTVSSGVDAFKKAEAPAEPKKTDVKPSPFTATAAPAAKAEPSKPAESAFAKPAEKKSPFGKPFSPKPSPSVHFDAGKPADKAPAKAEEKAPVIEDKKDIPAAGIAAGTAATVAGVAAGVAAAKAAEPKAPVAPSAPATKEAPKAASVAPAVPVVKDAPKAAPVAPAAPAAKEAPKAAPVSPAAPVAKEAAPAVKEAPKAAPAANVNAPKAPVAPARHEEPVKPADQAKRPVSNTGMAAASEKAPKEAPKAPAASAVNDAPKAPAAPAAKEAPKAAPAAAPVNKLNPADNKSDAKLDNANKAEPKRPAPRGTPQAPAIPPRKPVAPAANNTAAQNAFERNERKAASKAVPHDNHKQITGVTPVSKSKRKSKPVKETRSPGIAGVITLVCVMIAFVGVLWILSNTDKISNLFGGSGIVSISETKKEKDKETETEKITTATSEEETEPEETTTKATTESTTEATTEETTKETTEATTEETTKETTEETTKETTEETTTEATTVETTKKPSTSGGSVVTDFNTKLSGFKQTSGGFKFDITLTNKSNETADLKASLEEVDITFYANSDITSITCDEMTFTGSGKDWVGVPNGATIEAGDEYSFTVYVNTESSVTKYGYNSCYFDWN